MDSDPASPSIASPYMASATKQQLISIEEDEEDKQLMEEAKKCIVRTDEKTVEIVS